jgi:hypothetical protein
MKKLLVILSIFLATSAFGQEASKNKILVIADFSGGLATKLSDQSNNPKYARLVENIRLNDMFPSITKRDQIYTFGTADASEAITSMHRLYKSDSTKYLLVTHGDELEVADDTTGAFTSILDLSSSDYRWQWVTWHDLAIGGDGQNSPVKTNGSNATFLGTCFAEDNGAGAGPNGAYTYKVSFYTASYEVIFNVASNLVTVTDNDIDLSMIPIGPDSFNGEDIVGRKIYRSEVGGAGTYKLLTNGTIANNIDTTLTDSDADGALGADYPAGDATWTPPKCKYWVVHKNRLFGANDINYPSRIYYSKDSSHDLFESTDYRNIRANDGDDITFIKNLLGVLRVGKTNTIQNFYTTGDDPDADWEISDPISFIGCDAPYSAINTPIGILYLSRSRGGVYVFNGQNSMLKSEQITPTIEDILSTNLNNVCGALNSNLYFLSYASTSVGGSTNNRVLIYDLLSNSFTIDTMTLNAFCSFNGGGDGGTLYAGASDSGKVYQFANTTKELIHSKHADFTGTFDDMRYIPSGVAGGNSNSTVLELAWDLDIDNMVGTINAATGDVNRSDTGGTYISPVLTTTGAATYDKIYWNETLASGTNATFAIRSGASSAACSAAVWSSEYTIPSGSDISGETAGNYTQYRITMSTTDIDKTPYVTTVGGFTTKILYNTLGASAEAAIALHWRSNWIDFGIPLYKKALRKIFVILEGTNGTLTVTFTNEYGDTDSFDIDLNTYPTYYEEYFTNGALIGKKFMIDIANSDLNAVRVKEIDLLYDVEPLI